MPSPAAVLLLPLPDAGWQLSGEGRSPKSVTCPAECELRQDLSIGLPAKVCRSLGLVLPNADHSMMEAMVCAQLERLGLRPNGESTPRHRWHLIAQDAARALVSVDVLSDPFPEELLNAQAKDYTSALRLVELPSRRLVLLVEQGLLVAAVALHGRLYQATILGPIEGAEASSLGRELRWMALALAQEVPELAPEGLCWLGQGSDPSFLQALGQAAGLPVELQSEIKTRNLQPTNEAKPLLPAALWQSRASRARRFRLQRVGLILLALFLGLVATAVLSLTALEQEAAELAQRSEATQGQAQSVRQTAERWKQLLPAIEPRHYPLEILSEITALMPPSGIVVRRYQAKQGQIEVQGDARDAQTAVQFMEDLQKHPQLGRLQWSKPSPTVREGVAQFRTQGKPQ